MFTGEEFYDSFEKNKFEDEDEDEVYEESLQSRIFESLYANNEASLEVNIFY